MACPSLPLNSVHDAPHRGYKSPRPPCYKPHHFHSLLHHLAALSALSMSQEPLLEARKLRFTVKLHEPEVDDDRGHAATLFSLLSLAHRCLALSILSHPLHFIVFEAQEPPESLVGVAALPRRRRSSSSMLRTSPSSTVHAIVFHDSQAPSSTHSFIPANPTVTFRPPLSRTRWRRPF